MKGNLAISITKDFAGGNIKVVKITDDDVYLSQEIRDTSVWWFYWNFRITVGSPKKLTFHFEDGEVIGYFGPAINDGSGWHFDKNTFINHTSFCYDFLSAGIYQFAFSIPYQVEDFDKFYPSISNYANRHTAVKTFRGRDQFYINFGNQKSDKIILLTCRHHACESMAEFCLEGLIDELTASSNVITENYRIYCFPFIDLDGVEDGDQGKERQPHDHNRDYIDKPIYPTTRFIKKLTNKKSLHYAFDFHCPYKWYGVHDQMSLVEAEAPYCNAQKGFSRYFEIQNHSDNCTIEYLQSNNVVYGTEWNNGNPRSFTRFCNENGAKLAFSFEVPYFGARKKPYMPQELREFGHSFAKAVIKYYKDTKSL